MYVMADSSFKASHEAVAEAGVLARPRGWSRGLGTVKDNSSVECMSIDAAWRAHFLFILMFNIHVCLYIHRGP